MAGTYDDAFGSLFGGSGIRRPGPLPERDEKGVAWEAKVIDGKFYVPLKQVGDLLDANKVLPKVSAGIKRRVENGPSK